MGAGAKLTGKPEDRGFYSSGPGMEEKRLGWSSVVDIVTVGGAHGWDHSLTGLALTNPLAPLTLDSNMLGLR